MFSHHDKQHKKGAPDSKSPAAVRPLVRTSAQRAADGRMRYEDTQGTLSSNTVPSNSNPKEITRLLFGVDSLYLSFPGNLSEQWEVELEHLKLLAQSDSEKKQSLAQLEIGGHLLEVSD